MPIRYWFWHWVTGVVLTFDGWVLRFAIQVRAMSASCERRRKAVIKETD